MRVLLAAMLALGLGAAPAHAAVEYSVTDLSAPGNPTRDAWAINDAGVVVGALNTGAPTSAFRWTPDGGLRGMEGKNGIPLDINAAGDAVGLFDRPQDTFFTTGGRWDVFGTIRALLPQSDPACPGGDSEPDDCDGSFAHGISPDGVAVGAATINGGAGAEHAPAYWLLTASDAIRIQAGPGVLEARNAAGVMVGQDGRNAAVWRSPSDKVVLAQMESGDRALARDINDAGVVVGDGATRAGSSRNRAFTWTQSEGLRRLDTLGFGTEAHAISARGEIVGMSRVTDDDAGKRAVRWVDREIVDLNTLIPPDGGWTLTEAHDVNANGWIVGRGVKDGQDRAFLLRPAIALDVKLEGAGWDPFEDTFVVKATVRNAGSTPITGLRLTQDLTPAFPYPIDKRAIVVRLEGPNGVLPDTLEPGKQAEIAWLEQAGAPGFALYTARFGAVVRGLEQTVGSAVEVTVGEPGPLTLGDLGVLLVGQWHQLSDGVRARLDGMRRSLSVHVGKLRPFGKRSKIKPTAAERSLARSLGLNDSAFAAAPDNLKQTTDLVRTLIVERERAKYDALKQELGGAKKSLEAAGRFLERWTSKDGVAELTATGTELYRMARDGEFTGGYVGEAARYWRAPGSAGAALSEVGDITSEALAGTGPAYNRAVATGKKQLTQFEDDLSRDPERAMGQLVYQQTKLESKLAIEYGKSMLGDKLLKSSGLLRRLEKSADGVDDTVEAIDDEVRIAKAIDDTPPAPLNATQAQALSGMTPEMNQRLIGHAAAIQKRFPGIDFRVTVRPLSPGDVAKLEQGLIPKIEAIPIKKINDMDVNFLGADRGGLYEVGYFTPKKPPAKLLKALPDDLREDVLKRYRLRLDESRAMAGKPISDDVLEKKIVAMRKALGSNGHVFEETIQGRVIRRTELKLKTAPQGNLTMLKNDGLTINGRQIGRRGKGFTGDLDTGATLDGSSEIPAGVRGAAELSWQHAVRNDPLLPFGFHGWRGFDLTADIVQNTKLVMAEKISSLPRELAVAEATRVARRLGCAPEDLLRVRRNGFTITITALGIIP